MKENLEKYDFSICNSVDGAYCWARGLRKYLRKDGTLASFYKGDFFPKLTEAAEFLEQYLEENYSVEVSRAEVAEVLGVPLNFKLID